MRYLKYQYFGNDSDGKPEFLVKIAGVSGDTKPTAGIVGGSEFIETDTGKTFVFDEFSTTKQWNEKVVATAEVTP